MGGVGKHAAEKGSFVRRELVLLEQTLDMEILVLGFGVKMC